VQEPCQCRRTTADEVNTEVQPELHQDSNVVSLHLDLRIWAV